MQFIQENRPYIWSAAIVSIIIWIIFKSFYIHPYITYDSYYYTQAAALNVDVYLWPIGYSKFLRLVGHNGNVVVTIQYFFLMATFLYLLLTVRYFFNLGKWPSIVLFIFLFINPIFIHTCNHILSDSVFTGLSIIWLIQLIWIIQRPKPYMIFTQAILLVIIFSIRYNAMYYPAIATLAFILSKQKLIHKLAGIALQFILLGIFITYTTNKMEETAGVRQFSPFGAWKLLNNTLYMYEHVYKEDNEPVPDRFRELDNMIRDYFNKPHEKVDFTTPNLTSGSYYMLLYPSHSPLTNYMVRKQGKPNSYVDFKTFSPMGPLYEDYANYLIKKHPIAFIKYVVWPNMQVYLTPHPEVYNDDPTELWNNTVGNITKQWFRIQSISIPKAYTTFRQDILMPYPVINRVIHIIFLAGFIEFLLFKGLKRQQNVYAILLATILCFCNFGFIILAAASILRYQLFIIIVEFTLALYFLEFIYHEAYKKRE